MVTNKEHPSTCSAAAHSPVHFGLLPPTPRLFFPGKNWVCCVQFCAIVRVEDNFHRLGSDSVGREPRQWGERHWLKLAPARPNHCKLDTAFWYLLEVGIAVAAGHARASSHIVDGRVLLLYVLQVVIVPVLRRHAVHVSSLQRAVLYGR